MKKLMRILFISCFLLIGLNSIAENGLKVAAEKKLLLCSDYDKEGNPIGEFPTWQIRKTGNFMYILYKSSVPLTESLFVSFEKTFSRKDTNYYEYDHYYLVPDSSKKWAVNKYIFSKPGNYKISVFNRTSEELLQSYYTTINFLDDEYSEPFYTDTWYYSQSSIFFCDSIGVGDGKLIGRSDVFEYQPKREKIFLYIEQGNKKSFKTQHLYIKIYTRDTHKLVKSTSYSVSHEWFWTFIPIYLIEKGKYTVELYNEDDLYINSGDFEIK